LFIPPDCHHKKITQVECGIKLTQSHKFAVNSSWVNSYSKFMAKVNGRLRSMVLTGSVEFGVNCISQ
ncbi:hypothetical protein ACXHPS_14530, partial [Vibrio cincinnatiensis]